MKNARYKSILQIAIGLFILVFFVLTFHYFHNGFLHGAAFVALLWWFCSTGSRRTHECR